MKRLLPLVLLLVALAGCRPQMGEQPKVLPYEKSDFFADQSTARHLPAHTLARDALEPGTPFTTGLQNGALVATFPEPVTADLLQRGRTAYDINCALCHGISGAGDGMVVQRGFPPPPSFHSDRLRAAPVGHIFDVITRGYGVMYPYAGHVAVPDRWAIAAYIRVLQWSQHTPAAALSAEERAALDHPPEAVK